MKRSIRYLVLLLALCAAFEQANAIGEGCETVSLRFEEAVTLDSAPDFAALWSEETAEISGVETTVISFTGDAQAAFPARWVYGTPPSGLKENTCAVSTGFARECFGGQDVVGMKLGGEIICGVFEHESPVLLRPGREGFTAAEIFPVPEGTDCYRYGLDRAAQAGLPEPSEILCGPDGAFLARVLPWTLFLLPLVPLLGRKGWMFAGVLLILCLPDWFFPTRLSDTVFWSELFASILGRMKDIISLSPALRDQELMHHWFRLGAAVIAGAFFVTTRKRSDGL